MGRGNGENHPAENAAAQFVPMLASMTIKIYADGNIAYEAPISNLPVCFTMVSMMMAELAGLQFQRTRRQGGGIVMPGPGEVPSEGPRG